MRDVSSGCQLGCGVILTSQLDVGGFGEGGVGLGYLFLATPPPHTLPSGGKTPWEKEGKRWPLQKCFCFSTQKVYQDVLGLVRFISLFVLFLGFCHSVFVSFFPPLFVLHEGGGGTLLVRSETLLQPYLSSKNKKRQNTHAWTVVVNLRHTTYIISPHAFGPRRESLEESTLH